MSDKDVPEASEKPFPKTYLFISILTLLSTLVGTWISLGTIRPQQEKLKKETEKLRQEIDESNRRSRAGGPRIAQTYFIINSDSLQELDKDKKLNPKAGPDLGNLPRLLITDFTSKPPTPKEWRGLASSDACNCRYFYDWLSKHAKENLFNVADRIVPKTMYLTLQEVGPLPADELVLTADRVKIKTTTNDLPFEQSEFSGRTYESVQKVDLRLGPLQQGYGLRVPVAARVDFAARDLDSTGGLGGVGPPNEFYYGVMYIPRRLSYFDPFKEERVEIPIRPPTENALELSASTGAAG